MYPDCLDEHAPTLARHYEEAGDRAETLRYLILAGDAALTRHAMPESYDFYARAAALLETDPNAPAEMKIDVSLSAASAGMRFIPVAKPSRARGRP